MPDTEPGEVKNETEQGDTLVSFGETVKAIALDGDLLRVAAYGIRYGSEAEKDLQGEWFGPDTDYGPHHGDGMPSMVHHGVPLKAELAGLAALTLAPVKATQDAVGIFVEAVLDLSDRYQAAIGQLVKAGKLRWSSGTASHLVLKDDDTGQLKRWHPVEWSYTPTAAEPRLPAIMPVKALAEHSYPDLEAEPRAGATQAPAASATAGGVTVNVFIGAGADETEASDTPDTKAMETPKSTEVLTMSDEMKTTQPEPVDVAAIARQAAEQAVKAYREALEAERAENEPAIKSAGVAVTGDAADRALKGNPFKSAGEFYLAVATGSRPGGVVDPRLLPLRGGGDVENGFNVAKALGADYVGSLHAGSMRVKGASGISGLGERIPSDGGFFVGTDRGGLIERAYATGELLRRADVLPISAGSNGMTLYAEDETSRANGSRRGGLRSYWAAEGGTVTASKPKFREMNLKLRKNMCIVYATDELLADASALDAYILRNVPEEIRFMVEDSIFNGTGAGQPAGIMACGALISVAKESGQGAATINAENVIKMRARLWTQSRRRAAFFIDQTCEPQLHTMALSVGTGGQVVYMPAGGMSASPYDTLLGLPIVVHEYGAAVGTLGDIVLADLGEYQMIEKGGIESASSMHVLFLYDEQAFRFVYRVDGQSKWNAALTPKSGGDTQSPFVALAARA